MLFLAVNQMPEDVVAFLESIFDKPMHTWIKDPGYAGRIVGLCPPPSNSKLLVRPATVSVSCSNQWKIPYALVLDSRFQ
jgi:hypothetical protein